MTVSTSNVPAGATEPADVKVKARQANGLLGQSKFLPFLFTTPVIVLVSMILVFPVLYGVYQSMFRAEFPGGPKTFVGIENYSDLLVDPNFRLALSRTVVFVGGCLVLGTFLAMLFAFALNRIVNRRLRSLRAVTLMPYIVSSVAVAVMFRILFHQNLGQVNRFLEFVGLPAQEWLGDPHLAMLTVIIAQVWSDLPLSIILLLGGLQMIDPSLMDAASVDGATGWKRARYVSLPLIAPQIAISTLWMSYTTMTSLGTVLALTGGGPLKATQILPVELYATAFDRLETGQALAIATVILILNATLALGYVALSRRYEVAN